MNKPRTRNSNDLASWLEGQKCEPSLTKIIEKLSLASIDIWRAIQAEASAGNTDPTGQVNVQGEEQKPLDIISNEIVLQHLSSLNQIAACVSEEIDDLIINPTANSNAPYAVCFDPLDGSSNIETNSTIGTIFSILELSVPASPASEVDVLRASKNQVAAGYVLYGPTTLLVIATGKSVASFVLDVQSNQFSLSNTNLTIAQTSSDFAINMAYSRFWEPQITQYVDECIAGKTGPRNKDFNMRWSGAMVADVHSLLVRGGIFIYPALAKKGSETGKLRFLYEANPMAMIVEAAGGKANMRDTPIVDLDAENIHQRVPVILGSVQEVEYLTKLY